ncbi:MAG: hypothetical protein RLZZ488_1163, partial [Pseudomonadota bacterium]
ILGDGRGYRTDECVSEPSVVFAHLAVFFCNENKKHPDVCHDHTFFI